MVSLVDNFLKLIDLFFQIYISLVPELIYLQELYNISIMENITIPAVILQVKAIDEDMSLNG